jgi:hypothetical protein
VPSHVKNTGLSSAHGFSHAETKRIFERLQPLRESPRDLITTPKTAAFRQGTASAVPKRSSTPSGFSR